MGGLKIPPNLNRSIKSIRGLDPDTLGEIRRQLTPSRLSDAQKELVRARQTTSVTARVTPTAREVERLQRQAEQHAADARNERLIEAIDNANARSWHRDLALTVVGGIVGAVVGAILTVVLT